MHKPRRLLGVMAAFAMLTSTLTPVYANEVDLDLSGLLDDEAVLGLSLDDVTKESQGNWWKFEDGTLTLFGQLPDTGWNDSFAKKAGISASDVKKVIIESGTTAGTSLAYAFYAFNSLESIEGLDNLDTSAAKSLSSMFYCCDELTSLDLSKFNTANVTDFYLMFAGCNKLTSLNLPKSFRINSDMWLPNKSDDYKGWAKAGTSDIISGTGDKAVFTADSAGRYVRISSKWFEFDNGVLTLFGQLPDTTDEYNSFANLAGIYSKDSIRKIVIRPGTTAGKSLAYAFYYFTGLESIEGLGNLDTSIVTDMSVMFNNCSALTSLDVTKFNTANVTDMSDMFNGCSGLTSLDVTKFNTAKVTDMSDMFNGCSGITSLDVTKFSTANVTNMSGMFYGCSGLTSLDVTKFNTAKVTDMSHMFIGCSGLTSLDVTKFNTANVTDMSYMFSNCSGLTFVDVTKFNTAKVTDMKGMFYGCSGFTFLDITKLNTANVTNMSYMFTDCSGLTSLDVTKFNTANVTDMSCMFNCCSGLTSLDVTKFNTANVTNMAYMFCYCSGLTSLDVTKLNTANVTNMYAMFSGCSGLTSLDVTKLNTANVTDMSGMFFGCSGLTSLDVTKFNTTNVTNMAFMFAGCSGLTSLKLPKGFKVTDDMCLPNTNDGYKGWAKAGTEKIISGTGEYAIFTADTAGEYVHYNPAASPVITKIEPGYGKMNVAWKAVPNATSYKVYYKTGSTTKSVTRTGTGALINGIANGTYDVWVTAIVNGKETTQKNVKKAAVKGYYVTCKTTSGMIAGGIKIDWNKFDGATKYRVVCIDKSNKVVGTADTTALTYQWKGLKNNTEYGFYIQPFVNGVYPTFIRTDANDKKYIQWTIPVNAPMITKLSLGNQKVWLYYESVPRATKYYIYYKQKGDSKDTLAGTTTATKFLATGFKNNVATEFYVKALVDGKLTPLKRPATRTTRAGMKPTITVTAGQAALKWSKYTDCKASATKYKVVFVDANYKTIDYRETTNLSFTWKDKRLVKGKKYGFYVVPYVNGEYIPFGLSYANDKTNVVMFTAG